MKTTVILVIIIIILTIIAVKKDKKKKPWITKDEITRLEEIAKKRGER